MLNRRLKELSPDEQHNTIVDIMSEIKLVTGAIIYDGNMLQAQIEMIKRFIVTGFSELTKHEIILAFYLNSQGELDEVYRHYSRELNAEFIGDVLRAYRRYKQQLNRDKGRLIAKTLNPSTAVKMEIDYEAWKEIIQGEYFKYKNNSLDFTMWHDRKYYTLRKYGLLPYKTIFDWLYFFRSAMSLGRDGLNIPAGADLKKYKISSPAAARALFKTSDGYRACITLARQLAYGYVFGVFVKTGINNIWEDIKP